MTARSFVRALLCCVLFPALVSAQSAIAGVARHSAGVLPGVQVEASSPVLIDGARSATTDDAGQFRIVGLRPGVYTVRFVVNSFAPVTVEHVELSAEETRTVNADMRLGSLSEALTVSGAAPVVDVQNAARVTSLERSVIDNLPIGNNVWEMAQIIPGIDIYANFTQQASSVGGSYGAVQVYMSTHGQAASQNVVMVDGMSVSGLELDGTIQGYLSNDMHAEVSYQTSGIGADRSGGGVTVNMIPREGGNRFSGNARYSGRPGSWMGDNSARYNALGFLGDASLRYAREGTISQGGPILRDTLWFFGSLHQFNTSDLVDGVFFDDGEQGDDGQRIRQGAIRLTWKASPRHKLSGFYDRTSKLRTHVMGPGVDPETASSRWTTPHYGTGSAKLTSVLTNRLLFEGGVSFNREYRDVRGQEGIEKARGTPEWFASASRVGGGARTTAPADFSQDWPARDNFQGSVSYVTGAHQIKAGMQWQTGRFFHNDTMNADLQQQYELAFRVGNEWVLSNPFAVTVSNSPVSSRDRLNADLGIYAQDSWRLGRLTLNAGLRWEHINAQTEAWEAPEGRFAPRREVPALTDVPDWYDWAPRFSAVYDLWGDSRTAIKYGLNRYNRAAGTALANTFNVLREDSELVDWVDIDGDDIAEGGRTFIYHAGGSVTPVDCVFMTPGCEIDLSGLDPTGGVFGTPSAQDRYQGFPREWRLEHLVEVQHALTSRLSITGSWTRSSDRDLTKTVNAARREGDYVPMQIFHPVDGTPITIFSVRDTETRNRLRGADVNRTSVEPLMERVYHQLSLEYRLRPYAGAQLFGGFTMDREIDVDCTSSIAGFVVDPNDLRFCDEYDLPANGVSDPGGMAPWAKDFRIGVSLPLPWYGVTLGLTYLNNDTGTIVPTYAITPGFGATGTRYPDGLSTPGGASFNRRVAGLPAPACQSTFGCEPGAFVLPSGFIGVGSSSTSTFTIDLYPAGRIRRERLNQVDLKLSKMFRFRDVSVLPTFEAYNLFNEDTIFGYQSGTYATTGGGYLTPSATLRSRIVGIGAQVRW